MDEKLHVKWMNMPYQMDGKMTYMGRFGVRPLAMAQWLLLTYQVDGHHISNG
jgi:hypothetical protein